jgi:hypothetical protein
MLLPCVTFAETKCKVVEYPDRNEIDCGTEESSSVTTQQQNPQQQPSPSDQTTASQAVKDDPAPTEAPQTLMVPGPSSATTNQTVTQPASQVSQPSLPASNQGSTTQKHGRQQYQQSLEDAKAAKRQLILQRQNAPSDTVSPAPSGTPAN